MLAPPFGVSGNRGSPSGHILPTPAVMAALWSEAKSQVQGHPSGKDWVESQSPHISHQPNRDEVGGGIPSAGSGKKMMTDDPPGVLSATNMHVVQDSHEMQSPRPRSLDPTLKSWGPCPGMYIVTSPK